MDVAQRAFRNVGGAIVASRLRGAIGGEMLGGREDRVGGLEVVALEAAHARLGDAATQIDILARALGNSAPARIARDVDPRCAGPVYAFGRSFGGSNSRCLFNGLQVPHRRLPARERKNAG